MESIQRNVITHREGEHDDQPEEAGTGKNPGIQNPAIPFPPKSCRYEK